MSIINQALKKAQREQLLHETPHQLYASHQPPTRLHLLRWVIGAGCIVVLGVITTRSGWFFPPRQTGERQRPPIARQASVPAPPQTLSTPSPVPTEPDNIPATPTPPPVRPTLAATPQNNTVTSAYRSSQPTLRPPTSPPVMASTVPSTALSDTTRSRAQALFEQATKLQEQRQHARAIALLQQAVALDATYKDAYNKLGNLYYGQQAYRQAMDSFQKVLTIDPDDVKAHNNLGSTYLRLDMDEQAREVLHQAINIDHTYGLAYYNLACAYARKGDGATTAQYLKHAITIEPQARDWAQTDSDFRPVRNTPELRQLLGSESW